MPVHQQIFRLLDQPMIILKQRKDELLIEDANDAFLEMTGYTLQSLKSRDGRELSTRFRMDLTKRILKSEIKVRTKVRTELTIRVEQMPLPSRKDDWNRALLIVEDLTAFNWIEQQLEWGKVLMSGIIDKHLHIRFLHHIKAPFPFKHPDDTMEDETLLHFIDEKEHSRIKSLLQEAAHHQKEQTVKLLTSKQSGTQLELELTFCPIRNGFGKCNMLAFVIWDIKPAGEDADDPSVKLKIWMAKRDVTAGQLAKATGISLQTISKLRNGKIKKPQRLTAELIASELGVDTHEIWPALRK